MHKENRKKVDTEIAIESIGRAPKDSIELINKYGTYEIQPTADTTNSFPTIAQGFPKNGKKPTKDNDAVPSENPSDRPPEHI